MTERRPDVNDFLKQMKAAAAPPEDASRAQRRREQIVGKLETLHADLVQEQRRGRKWRAAGTALSVAALIPLGAFAWQNASRIMAEVAGSEGSAPGARVSLVSGSVTAVRAGLVETVRVGSPIELHRADRVHTHDQARATVSMESGASVRVAEATELALLDLAQSPSSERLGLESGSVEVEVPKLPQGGSFVVKTGEATVVVHGTHFFVDARRDALGTFTNVRVTEGRVAVHHDGVETMLGPGDHWSSRVSSGGPTPGITGSVTPAGAATPEAAPGPAVARTPTHPAQGRAPHAAHDDGASSETDEAASPGGESPEPALPSSSLAAENALFKAAMEASRSGAHEVALARHQELMTRYPLSPLVQNARVERFRTLRRLGRHAEAAREARRYLADYPGGFAQAEARDVALGPPEAP
jgi:hypothetical protein